MKNFILLFLFFFISCNKKDAVKNEIPVSETDTISKAKISYFEFTPDTITDVKIEGFEISAAYKLGDKKIVTGYYDAVGGKLSHHDSDTNYGPRLLLLNDNNKINYTSKGAMDAFLFKPHFYKNNSNGKIIIVCQLAFEYYFGGDAFLFDNGVVKPIGNLDIASLSEEESLIDILKINEIEKQLLFSFKPDSLLLEPGSKDLHVKNENLRYVFENGSLKFYQ